MARRGPNISPVERRKYLELHEAGSSINEIAHQFKRTDRTIRQHLEQVRGELDWQEARRGQIRDVLRAHQEDLLELVARTWQAFQSNPISHDHNSWSVRDVSALTGPPSGEDLPFGPNVGYPNLAASAGGQSLPANREPAFILVCSGSKSEIRLREEDSKRWLLLLAHITKDDLLAPIDAWKKAQLVELNALWTLNQAIRVQAEALFAFAETGPPTAGDGMATPALVPAVRIEVLNNGDTKSAGFLESLHYANEALTTPYSTDLVRWLSEAGEESARERLRTLVTSAGRYPETRKARESRRVADQRRQEVLEDVLEDVLLMKHVLGRCRLCRTGAGR